MSNSDDLRAFHAWRAERPHMEDNIVSARDDNKTRTAHLLWAGPPDELAALHDEATRLRIKLLVRQSRYTPKQISAAADAVFDAVEELAQLNFDLAGIALDADPEGLEIYGSDTRGSNAEADTPLDPQMVIAVREHLTGLDRIRGVIAIEDIRVTPGKHADPLVLRGTQTPAARDAGSCSTRHESAPALNAA